MQQPIEVEVEEDEQIVERVAAVDVAKASGMVCTGCRTSGCRASG